MLAVTVVIYVVVVAATAVVVMLFLMFLFIFLFFVKQTTIQVNKMTQQVNLLVKISTFTSP